MKNISAIVIAKNEEANVVACLESISWVDEIIFVDAESTDKTLELAKPFTSKIFVNKWEGFAKQKEFALGKTTNEWVLSIDCDERVTPLLKEEILNLVPDETDGYYLWRENYLLKRHIKSCGWDNDFQLRLVRKSKAKLTNRLVHEGLSVDGKTKRLNHRLIHYTFTSIEKTMTKINHYTTLRAEELFNNNKNTNAWGIVAHGTAGFFKFFVLQGGFRDGVYGLVISLFHAITTLLSYMKLWELQVKNKTKNNKHQI
ncbi:MAG: glycosyltransferase family 2 protein [Ignavibacteriaceae bacterium]|nr:glycosyltransferase family 2 protein [Ignavibacteriaceae bacterium]